MQADGSHSNANVDIPHGAACTPGTPQAPVTVSISDLQRHLSDVAQATRSVSTALTRMLLSGSSYTDASAGGRGGNSQTLHMHATPRTAGCAVQKLLEGSKPLMRMWETRHVDVAAGVHCFWKCLKIKLL